MNWRTTLLLALTALVITPLAYRSVQDARPQYVVAQLNPFPSRSRPWKRSTSREERIESR